jgi:hypothetical protein
MVVDGQIIKNQFLTKSTTEGLRVTILSTIELIIVYLTSLCVNWVFFGTSAKKGPIYTRTSSIQRFFCLTSPLKAPNRLKPLQLA